MYYVNREQIGVRLQAIPAISEALRSLAEQWSGTLIEGLAQERALHLAIETITDVGSYLIDGFIMRDASSYEDIIEIIGEEGAFPKELQEPFIALVKLRKPLVQDYYDWQRAELHPQSRELAEQLLVFKTSVEQYIERELIG
ncbi:DUF86 domain-containing protein [Paenibacillus radicis (ex Gao et al. 2016)]|uniref:DUF86 domain-containing protein n=1 Tax=Paenibacillus radicis (ex Gao et al. 2016) TaxID=1737354 RepID=A0A917GS22_9BACL|nr:HepT-like ribonuclease domain-containing protein [Paenibacillus radicis (ex Gao et al. 2016)]GGG55389.1 hypothetical protein GCM10010918_05340 [Paenibacillus radicis (ex Gao et al. 2016)]